MLIQGLKSFKNPIIAGKMALAAGARPELADVEREVGHHCVG